MTALQEEKISIQLARLGGSKDPFEIDLYWTVNQLLTTVSTKCNIPPENLKLLCKGKMLNSKIGNKTLKSIKIKPNDKIIVMVKKVIKRNKNPPQNTNTNTNNTNNNNNNNNNTHSNGTDTTDNKNNIDEVIKRKKNLSEIKAAAEALAQRDNDGYDWNANYFLELTNQYGNKIHLPNNQRQALTVGLTLHEKGKKFMKSQNYKDAIYIMNLAFESFGKVDATFLQAVDNYGLLALDIVWCYYLDKDEKNLSNAGQWLQIAEIGLQRAHGQNMERLKQIRSTQNMSAVTGDFIPELSLYVRLNILRALQSFYNGDINGAGTHLMRAEMDMRKLQISDIDLVKLESMGFHHKESRRALRFCAGNIDEAINHIYNKRDEIERKRDDERRRREERALQRKYGATKNGKFVDLSLLKQLENMGVEKEIAIEALRQTDNGGDDTLNLCLDIERKEILTQTLYARYFNDKFYWKIEQILGVLGGGNNVSESRVRAALFLCFNDVEDSVNMLTAPSAIDVVNLDRVEARFIPYVQKRHERILREKLMAEKMRKMKQEAEKREIEEKRKYDEEMAKNNMNMNVDGNSDNDNDNNNEVEMDENETTDNKSMVIDDGINNNNNDNDNDVIDDDLKRDDKGNVIEPIAIKNKAMPNPNLGDINENENENDNDNIMNDLVNEFKPISNKLPNDDDMKIEQHILDDLDNDDEEYLDIDLTNEKDALDNLKGLLNSMQMNANAQNNQQSFLSLFKK